MLARPRRHRTAIVALGAIALVSGMGLITSRAQTPATEAPVYTAEGRLEFPKAYREWVYLSSGMDMSYLDNPRPGQSTFGNVFVNPQAYRAFLETGTWPDTTILVLEVRAARQDGSINRNGHFQAEIVHTEAHVKDAGRFDGEWAFFAFASETPAAVIPRTANCYSCHQEHGAVDTTFVQFYPTLLPVARSKDTLSTGYRTDENGRARPN